jgi:hypothetical protein
MDFASGRRRKDLKMIGISCISPPSQTQNPSRRMDQFNGAAP